MRCPQLWRKIIQKKNGCRLDLDVQQIYGECQIDTWNETNLTHKVIIDECVPIVFIQ